MAFNPGNIKFPLRFDFGKAGIFGVKRTPKFLFKTGDNKIYTSQVGKALAEYETEEIPQKWVEQLGEHVKSNPRVLTEIADTQLFEWLKKQPSAKTLNSQALANYLQSIYEQETEHLNIGQFSGEMHGLGFKNPTTKTVNVSGNPIGSLHYATMLDPQGKRFAITHGVTLPESGKASRYQRPESLRRRLLSSLVRDARISGDAGVGIMSSNELKFQRGQPDFVKLLYRFDTETGKYVLGMKRHGQALTSTSMSEEQLKQLMDSSVYKYIKQNVTETPQTLFIDDRTRGTFPEFFNKEHLLDALPEELRSGASLETLFKRMGKPDSPDYDLLTFNVAKFPKSKQGQPIPTSLFSAAGLGTAAGAKVLEGDKDEVAEGQQLAAGLPPINFPAITRTVGKGLAYIFRTGSNQVYTSPVGKWLANQSDTPLTGTGWSLKLHDQFKNNSRMRGEYVDTGLVSFLNENAKKDLARDDIANYLQAFYKEETEFTSAPRTKEIRWKDQPIVSYEHKKLNLPGGYQFFVVKNITPHPTAEGVPPYSTEAKKTKRALSSAFNVAQRGRFHGMGVQSPYESAYLSGDPNVRKIFYKRLPHSFESQSVKNLTEDIQLATFSGKDPKYEVGETPTETRSLSPEQIKKEFGESVARIITVHAKPNNIQSIYIDKDGDLLPTNLGDLMGQALPEEMLHKKNLETREFYLRHPDTNKHETVLTALFPEKTKVPGSLYALAGLGAASALVNKENTDKDLSALEGPMLSAGVGLPPNLSSAITSGMKSFKARTGMGTQSIFRGFLDKIDDYYKRPETALLRDTSPAFRHSRLRLYNRASEIFAPIYDLDKAQMEKVSHYLMDMEEEGVSLLKLSTKESRAAKAAQDAVGYMTFEQIKQGGPYVRDKMGNYQPKSSSHIWQVMKPEVREALLGGPNIDQARLESIFIKRLQKLKGMSVSESQKVLDEWKESMRTPITEGVSADPSYAENRMVNEYGLPREFLRSLPDRLQTGAFVGANDLAFWKHFQNPDDINSLRLARTLGLDKQHDGRGQPYPKDIKWDSGEDVASFSNNPDVKAWWDTDVNLFRTNRLNFLSPAASLINAGRIGILSSVRDVIGTGGAVWELLGSGDANAVIAGLKGLAGSRIYDVGGLRRPSPFLARMKLKGGTGPGDKFGFDEASGAIGRIAEAGRTVFGRNAVEAKVRQFLYEAGRIVTGNRLNAGDEQWMKRMVGDNWKTLSVEEITDRGAHTFVERFQGSYSASDLPKWLLPGKEGVKTMEGIFQLARWSVGRYNSMIKNTITPLKEDGNFGPLLKSVLGHLASGEVINQFNTAIRQRKPRELTWEEWLKLDKPEALYTIASKLHTAGFAGILSQLAFGGTQMMSGELPLSFSYPVVDFAVGGVGRLVDMFQAVSDGLGIPTALSRFTEAMADDNIQLLNAAKARESAQRDPLAREEHIYRRIGRDLQPPLKRGLGEKVIQPPTTFPRRPDVIGPVSNFRRAIGPEGITEAAPELLQSMRKTGEVPVIRGAMRPASFYDFMERAQGKASAEQAKQIDRAREMDVIRKRMIIRRFQSTAVNPILE